MLATHTSFTVAPSPTRRFQVSFELRAVHDRAGAGVKHSTPQLAPPLIRPRGGIEVHRVLRVSGSLPTLSNARHGQTLCSHTLRAAFHGPRVTRHQPEGGNGCALTLWRCVGTLGTPSTRTIVVYA